MLTMTVIFRRRIAKNLTVPVSHCKQTRSQAEKTFDKRPGRAHTGITFGKRANGSPSPVTGQEKITMAKRFTVPAVQTQVTTQVTDAAGSGPTNGKGKKKVKRTKPMTQADLNDPANGLTDA